LRGFLSRSGIGGERADELLEGYIQRIGSELDGNPPPVAGAPVYREIRGLSGEMDIYLPEKHRFTDMLLDCRSHLIRAFNTEDYPLTAALRASTWGNLIDVAQGRELPREKELLDLFSVPLSVDDTVNFLEKLTNARTMVIIGDNAGETVLDRLFLELLEFHGLVYYAVRPAPMLNDAVRSDAERAGLDAFCTIVDTGFDAPTILAQMVGSQLASLLDAADLILSKGQGNLEGLFGARDSRLYYSFVVKCPVVADAVNLPEGSGVFASSVNLPGKEF
jgi:uncharacterized protein with ATP-grasp and redox domains